MRQKDFFVDSGFAGLEICIRKKLVGRNMHAFMINDSISRLRAASKRMMENSLEFSLTKSSRVCLSVGCEGWI